MENENEIIWVSIFESGDTTEIENLQIQLGEANIASITEDAEIDTVDGLTLQVVAIKVALQNEARAFEIIDNYLQTSEEV